MGSSRMPGKSLMKIGGISIIERIYKRLKLVNGVNKIILATTSNSEDEELANFFSDLGGEVFIFDGPQDDVLGRFYGAYKKFPSDIVVRVCGDCPLISFKRIKDSIDLLKENPDAQYVAYDLATVEEGIEVFSSSLLELLEQKSKDPLEREHVTGYYHKSLKPEREITCSSNPDLILKGSRFSVDTPADLNFFTELFDRLGGSYDLCLEKVVSYLKANPAILDLNSSVIQRLPDKVYPSFYLEDSNRLAKDLKKELQSWAIHSLGVKLLDQKDHDCIILSLPQTKIELEAVKKILRDQFMALNQA